MYQDYVLENNFNKRAELIVPLILDEIMKPIEKEKKYYYMRHKTRIDAENEYNQTITIVRCQILKQLNNMITDVDIGNFLYYGEKSLKNKVFMLRYMVYLTDLEDRLSLYDAFMMKKKIPLSVIKQWYNDIDYKFYTLRLPYTREEQDKYHERNGFKTIEEIDEMRERNGLFTRNDLTENDLTINKQDLFVNILPEKIVKKNTNTYSVSLIPIN
jgi:hypothetical protein